MTDATSCPLFFLWFSFCLCSVVSLPVFARSPYVFLLGSVTVSGAVAAEDGALELLLKTKSRACCRITTVSPFVSLFCSFVPLFFSVRVLWFSPPGFCGALSIRSSPVLCGLSLAFIKPGNAMQLPLDNEATDRCCRRHRGQLAGKWFMNEEGDEHFSLKRRCFHLKWIFSIYPLNF